MPTIAAVAAGGALGALARYGLDRFLEHRVDALFPWSTFLINVSGCFALALVVALVVDRAGAPQWLSLGLTFGFLGAYTTFSTFAFEAYELLELRHVALAVIYAASSVAAGIAAVALAWWVAHR